MSSTISTLNVKLTATTAAFTSGIASAAKPLASFGSSIASVGSRLVGWGSALTALAAGGSMLALVSNSLSSIDALKDQADAIGVSTDALSRLNYAASFAGVESEAMGASLGKMLKNVNEARTGSGAAADAFRMLGLDAAKLAEMPADEAFREIAGAMQSVENPAQRVGLAMDIFGKSGTALLPVLANGKDGLAAMAAEADRFGVTIKATDAAKIEAANDAMDKMSAAITGAANTLAIQLAPFIEMAAAKLTDFITSGEQGLTGKVVAGFEAVVGAVAYASDYLHLLEAGFKLLQSGATYAVFGIVKAIDFVGSGLVDLLNLLPGVELEWTNLTGDLADGLLEEAGQLSEAAGQAFDDFSRGKNSDAVAAMFDRIRQSSQAAADAVVASGPTIGKAIAELGDEGDETAQRLAESEAQRAQEDLQRRAQAVFDDTRTPLENYEQRIGELSELLNAGAIDWDTYGRAVQKARGDLEGGAPEGPSLETEQPELIQSGSAQAARFAYDMSRGQSKLDDKGDLTKKQLAEQQDANRILQQIARNTQGGTADVGEVVTL